MKIPNDLFERDNDEIVFKMTREEAKTLLVIAGVYMAMRLGASGVVTMEKVLEGMQILEGMKEEVHALLDRMDKEIAQKVT